MASFTFCYNNQATALAFWSLLLNIGIVASASHYPFAVYPYKAKGCHCSGRVLAPPLPPPSFANDAIEYQEPKETIERMRNGTKQNATTTGKATPFVQFQPFSSGSWPPFLKTEYGYGQRRVVNISETPLEHIRLMEANSTFSFEWMEGWRCSCHEISAIPTDMPPALSQLVLSNTAIPQITQVQLAKYKVLKSLWVFLPDCIGISLFLLTRSRACPRTASCLRMKLFVSSSQEPLHRVKCRYGQCKSSRGSSPRNTIVADGKFSTDLRSWKCQFFENFYVSSRMHSSIVGAPLLSYIDAKVFETLPKLAIL